MPNHVDLSYMSERVWSGNNSSGIDHDCEPDENGMDTDFTPLVEQHSWIFNGLLTIFVILLIVVGVILPFWNIYQQKQCVRQEEHRRRVSIKIAGPIREKYLYDLMKDFSKILLAHDVCVIEDIENSVEDSLFGTTKTSAEIRYKGLTSDSGKPVDESEDIDDVDNSNDDNAENVNNTNNGDIDMQQPQRNPVVESMSVDDSPGANYGGGCDDNESRNADDIEMQWTTRNVDEERNEKEEDRRKDGSCSTLLACDGCRAIFVPLPGQKAAECRGDDDNDRAPNPSDCDSARKLHHQTQRTYSDACVVCLNPFVANDTVTWSSNKNCSHVFHQRCLLEWFSSVGKKAWKKKYIQHGSGTNNDLETALPSSVSLMQKEICDFPTLCPCCQQDFFLERTSHLRDSGESSNDDSSSSNTMSVSPSLSGEESNEDDH